MACLLADASSLSTPVPDSLARMYLAPEALPEDAPVSQLFCTGLYLIKQGKRDASSKVLGLLQSKENDAEPIVKELGGSRAVRAGDVTRAERLLTGHYESGQVGAI